MKWLEALLEAWVATPLAGAAGWALLDSLWECAIVAAALVVALMVLRSPRARYGAAWAAMLATFIAFGVTLVRAMPADGQVLRVLTPHAFPWNVAAVGGSLPARSDLAAVAPWLAPFWAAGVTLFYLGQATGWISVYRLRRRGVCCASAHWQETVVRLSARLRVTRPVVLLESCLADTPVVLGHWRPVILTPVGMLAGLPAGQVEAILLHELAHIRRADYLVNACQRLVEGIFFYHPAVWWMSGVIRAERENCCDDVAVATSGDAREYAAALAALEQNRCSGRSPAVAATGGNLVKRIRRLLYPRGPHGAWMPLAAALVLMVTAALALNAWQSGPPPKVVPDSPYVRWLNEDVVYIVADRERAAFLKLGSDEERKIFIEQFWQRRNPTPGAAENVFKIEHYLRIAYANTHFETPSGGEGWQTDRGHIYIVYGPPDEIESHPKPKGRYAFEEWMYHHVEGIGDNVTVTFVDRTGSGDWRLAPGRDSFKSKGAA
jgi:GWxTD domain-containing protein